MNNMEQVESRGWCGMKTGEEILTVYAVVLAAFGLSIVIAGVFLLDCNLLPIGAVPISAGLFVYSGLKFKEFQEDRR